MKKNILVIFGTRPEAIKMCPLINVLKADEFFDVTVCITGQHREMLEQVLEVFDIKPDYNLNIMKERQTLFDITVEILEKIKKIIINTEPDIILVHGDTTTSFVSALAGFYLQIPVGHVEAGLRTYNIKSPYPEEFNRQAIGNIAEYHFAPTLHAKDNLVREGKKENKIFVTGNTAIDALKTTVKDNYWHKELEWVGDSKLILLTAHRRENLGVPMENMFKAINRVVEEHDDVKVIYPIHMNPKVREIAGDILKKNDKIHIIEPLSVVDFHNFLSRSYLVLTDSGGIQEEAPALGKPVLVMRDTTERPEGVEVGTLKLVGTEEESIYINFKKLIEDKEIYRTMSELKNPYGDGFASNRIAKILKERLV